MATFRQKKAIATLVAKGGSVGAAMREAGYSANTARTPSKLTSTESFKAEVGPIVEQLEAERQRLMEAIAAKDLGAVQYKDLVDSVDKLTKNIQLLNGGKTSNDRVSFGWEE